MDLGLIAKIIGGFFSALFLYVIKLYNDKFTNINSKQGKLDEKIDIFYQESKDYTDLKISNSSKDIHNLSEKYDNLKDLLNDSKENCRVNITAHISDFKKEHDKKNDAQIRAIEKRFEDAFDEIEELKKTKEQVSKNTTDIEWLKKGKNV